MFYQDKQITITKDFIRVKDFEIEAIAISTIKKAYVKAQVIGDFKNVAIMFFVLGILSIWFLIGFVFIALGIGAWNTMIYKYILLIERDESTFSILEDKKKSRITSLCATINGLILSNKQLHKL